MTAFKYLPPLYEHLHFMCTYDGHLYLFMSTYENNLLNNRKDVYYTCEYR